MPLHPQAEAFLAQLKASGVAPVTSLTPVQARERMIRLSVFGTPFPLAHVQDRTVPGAAGDLPARVYSPGPAASTKTPVIHFHGGGFVTGSRDTHDPLCRRLSAALERVVVAVDYRLAPEHPFPIPAEDAWAATQWLAAHAGEVGAADGPIIVSGDSAGGGLAAVVAGRALDQQRQPAIAGMILEYPVLDFNLETNSYRQMGDGYMLTRDTMAWFWKHYLPRPEDGANPEASPLRREDLHGFPPTVVITAEYDPLHDEGDVYARRLTEAGVPTRLLRYEGQIHDFMRRAHLFDAGQAAFADVAAALNELI